jgi:sulfur carrier protein ThiS adenylyltransferase
LEYRKKKLSAFALRQVSGHRIHVLLTFFSLTSQAKSHILGLSLGVVSLRVGSFADNPWNLIWVIPAQGSDAERGASVPRHETLGVQIACAAFLLGKAAFCFGEVGCSEGRCMGTVRIKINEQWHEVDEKMTLLSLRDRLKPQADLIIYNGFPQSGPMALNSGDEVVFIRRGEVPSREELEAQMMARHTPGVHEKVRKACVGIAGLGGLGSSVAVALARVGVGHLILVDFDLVEPSNLNRQQYFLDQLGMPKVEALKDNLNRINPYVHVEGHEVALDRENIPRIFSRTRIVVEAFDRAEMKEMLITTIMDNLPDHVVIAASGLAGYGPNNHIRTERIAKNLYMIGDQISAARPGWGLMAPRVGIAAHQQANLVLRLILGEEDEGE